MMPEGFQVFEEIVGRRARGALSVRTDVPGDSTLGYRACGMTLFKPGAGYPVPGAGRWGAKGAGRRRGSGGEPVGPTRDTTCAWRGDNMGVRVRKTSATTHNMEVFQWIIPTTISCNI